MWTQIDEAAYRLEMKRRFTMRTPAKSIEDILIGTRVGRDEMRTWSLTVLQKMPEELDIALMKSRANWYRQMARKVLREKGIPESEWKW